ncbi:YheU family protein [Thalassolituus sp.]|uniref:YheU family protein n=1 Tax=Thalassolituus sp. TaxID=2030822 RepID=UPI002634736F|nr:YheU family protein [uncultured Thalassolituus sp.]
MPCEDAPQEGVLRVPAEMLSADALDGIIEEFVSREGTDYGDYDFSFDDKKNQVREQIRRGQVVILFDPVGETCQLALADQLPPGI